MLLSNDEVESRLNSAGNLLNRLRITTNRHEPESNLGNGNLIDENSIPAEIIESERESRREALAIFGVPDNKPNDNRIPTLPPSVDDLIGDAQSKIKLGLITQTAMDVMSDALTELQIQLPSVDNPRELVRVAAEMGKIVTGIRNSESKANEVRTGPAQVVIWKPIVMNENNYDQVIVPE